MPTHFGPSTPRARNTSVEERWGSMSATRVFKPRRCAASAMWVATVVFPEPPFRAMTAMVRMGWFASDPEGDVQRPVQDGFRETGDKERGGAFRLRPSIST